MSYRNGFYKRVRELKQAKDHYQSAEVLLGTLRNPYMTNKLYASYIPDKGLRYRLEHDEHVYKGMGRELVMAIEAQVEDTPHIKNVGGKMEATMRPKVVWMNDPSVLEVQHFVNHIETDIILFEDLFWRWGVEKPRWPEVPLKDEKEMTMREPDWDAEGNP